MSDCTTDINQSSGQGVAKIVAILPGFGEYTDSSDSISTDSDDDIDVATRRYVSIVTER